MGDGSRAWLATSAILAAACGSFGAADDTPRGSAEDAAAPDAGDGGGEAAASFCASLAPMPFFCDEFSSPSLDENWATNPIRDGRAMLSARGPAPPSALLVLPDGEKCSGDQVHLALRRATTTTIPKVRVRAKVNIDDTSGAPLLDQFNGGPQVDFIGPNSGRCAFYVGWIDGIPSMKVDRVPAGGQRIASYRTRALMSAPVTAGRWVDFDLSFTTSPNGTTFTWTADGTSGSDTFAECTFVEFEALRLVATCSTAQLLVGFDDVALWIEP